MLYFTCSKCPCAGSSANQFQCCKPVFYYSCKSLRKLNGFRQPTPYLPRFKAKTGCICFFNTVNGKQYIGSSIDLYKRLLEHLDGSKSNTVLQRAFSKHGLDRFLFYVYEFYVPNNAMTLVDLEDRYINAFDFDYLYNLNPNATSSLGYTHTEQAKAKMRLRLKDKENHPFFGKTHTEETKKLISKPGKLNPMYGRKHSEETRNLLSVRKSKFIVGLFDVNNVLVMQFTNNVEVARYLGCHKGTVGRYIKSGKLWCDKYYIKLIGSV